MQATKLDKQLRFLREIDRRKSVVRQSPLLDKSRKENSAEHSWHLALYALVLNEYASESVNTNRVIQMLLLHDVVEIDVGESQWIKPSLKLNPVETAFLNEAAAQADMSVSAFIRMALRSQMTKMAILNNDEVTALYQSNFQLLRIGRNLNQIARALNAQESAELTSQKIEDVQSLINEHTDKVRDLITSNQERLQ